MTPKTATSRTSRSEHGETGTGSGRTARLRKEISETREELGETVAALAARTDVAGQARKKASQVRAEVRESADAAVTAVREHGVRLATRVEQQFPVAVDRSRQKLTEWGRALRRWTVQAGRQLAQGSRDIGTGLRDRTPEPVRARVSQAVESGRRHPGRVAAAGLVTVVLVRRWRRNGKRR